MATLARSRAFGAGFRLIAERPCAVLAWIGVYLLIGLAPQALMFVWVLGDFAATEAGEATAGAMMRAQFGLPLLQLVQVVGGLSASAILSCAVMRALLEPQDSARAYLRLGVQEALVGAVLAVGGVLLFILLAVSLIPILFAAALAALASNPEGGGGAGGVVVALLGAILVSALLIGLSARFLPALPMTFAERTFRLFEAWTLTRGHGRKLAELMIALAAAAIAIELVAFIIMAVPMGMFMAGRADQMGAWMDGAAPVNMGALAPWIVLFTVLFAVLSVLVNIVVFAPWVDVYRQLAAEAAPA